MEQTLVYCNDLLGLLEEYCECMCLLRLVSRRLSAIIPKPECYKFIYSCHDILTHYYKGYEDFENYTSDESDYEEFCAEEYQNTPQEYRVCTYRHELSHHHHLCDGDTLWYSRIIRGRICPMLFSAAQGFPGLAKKHELSNRQTELFCKYFDKPRYYARMLTRPEQKDIIARLRGKSSLERSARI